ncbi:uncharacterized protein FFB14_06424 [Fusarium fujikuroi]|nr:uncharacterized protein FFB14_06424 [Fusarium fujikuroi]
MDRFFSGRKSPSQIQCDEIAQSVSGASTVSPVDSPGSMSYTVICSGRPEPQQDLIVSFREPGAMLDKRIVKLAKEIHSDLVPESSTCHGNVKEADPLLRIDSMPYLRGSSYIEVLAFRVEMDPQEEAKHEVFVQHLARTLHDIGPALGRLTAKSKQRSKKESAKDSSCWRKNHHRLFCRTRCCLSSLRSSPYFSVKIIHKFSRMATSQNILVDENTFQITGIVDWSLASVMPFGMDLDILFLTTGFMTQDGWHDYACQLLLRDTFWKEFWAASGIEEGERRGRMQGLAEAAGQIGAILRLAFRRNADGSPSEEVLVSESRMKQLRAWFGE